MMCFGFWCLPCLWNSAESRWNALARVTFHMRDQKVCLAHPGLNKVKYVCISPCILRLKWQRLLWCFLFLFSLLCFCVMVHSWFLNVCSLLRFSKLHLLFFPLFICSSRSVAKVFLSPAGACSGVWHRT